MHIRLGSRISVRGLRWEYFEGGAYFEATRRFFEAGDGEDVTRAPSVWEAKVRLRDVLERVLVVDVTVTAGLSEDAVPP